MRAIVFVQNLKCSGCEATLTENLSRLKNIKGVSVNLKYATVSFEYRTLTDLELVKKELSRLGYPPFGENNSIKKKVESYVS